VVYGGVDNRVCGGQSMWCFIWMTKFTGVRTDILIGTWFRCTILSNTEGSYSNRAEIFRPWTHTRSWFRGRG